MNDLLRSEIARNVTLATAKLREKAEARAMEGDLLSFVRYVWPVVEPAIPFVEGWAITAIAEHLQAVTKGEIRRLLINVPPGFTKAITYETLVPTLGGWKPHGALRIGDYVFGPDGLPRVITNRTPNVLEPCYEITFDDGLKITAGAAHEWAIERDFPNQNHDGRGKWGRKSLIVETRDLLVGKGRQRSDRIPMSAPIQFPRADLEIEPYLLGYWLGDGDAGLAVIYCGKTDLAHVEILGREVVGTGTAHRVQIDDLKERLHYFDLVKNKHIPEEYFEGSVAQRWELVRGLMDSDGQADIDRDGQVRCRFTSENEKIIDGLHRILSSLGIKASRNGNRLRFTPPLGAKVFKLERKQSRLDARKIPPRASRIGYRYIKSVVPIGQKVVNCIEVDGGIYVAASHCFVTRNSLLTNVFWPAWEWGPQNRPWYRYVCASYSNHLTERDNLRCRNVVMSERYQRLWRGRFRISNEQFTKVKFANDQTGWKLATSVGGIGVGERGDRFVIDDPNNTMMMESEAVRWTTNKWITEVVPERLNNPNESAIVVIQQRLHEEDVSGVALDNDLGYTHLCIPMYYVPNGMVCGYDVEGKIRNFDLWDDQEIPPEKVFWVDPRHNEGDLAWPERFGTEQCEEIRHAKKEYAWSGQYQQSPEIRGGSIIRRDYWQTWDAPKFPENIEYILASLDTAYTEKQENDASALTIWGLFRDANRNPKFILLHAWNERLEMHALVNKVIQSCAGDLATGRPPVDRLLIESKASGLSVSQEIRRLIGFNGLFGIELVNPGKGMVDRDKVARAHSIIHLFADGMVYTPKGITWADQVINQCAVFPKGTHDDLVDSVTMAMRYLRDFGYALTREEARYEIEEQYRYRPRMGVLYPC